MVRCLSQTAIGSVGQMSDGHVREVVDTQSTAAWAYLAGTGTLLFCSSCNLIINASMFIGLQDPACGLLPYNWPHLVTDVSPDPRARSIAHS